MYSTHRQVIHSRCFNGHIWEMARGYNDVHGGLSFEVRNEDGISLLVFTKAFDLVVADLCF